VSIATVARASLVVHDGTAYVARRMTASSTAPTPAYLPQRSSAYAWYVVAVLTVANVSSNVDRQILALLVGPIQRDLGLSDTQMSYLGAVPFAVFYSLMGLPIARLADSTNRRNVIAVGIGVWSIMTALCGLAGSYSRLLLARVGVGVGEAALQAPAASLLADYFPPARLNSAMSVYALGNFLGSGLAYFVGGWIVGLVSARSAWTWPLVGELRPWQTVFIIVGLPGLLIALLLLSVREPTRSDGGKGRASLSDLFLYVRSRLRAVVCHHLGFALSVSVNFGIAFWLATMLVRKFGWTYARAGMVQGTMTMTVGVMAVVVGGRLADLIVARGRSDGPLLVGIIAAAGMLVSATAYPLAATPAVCVAWLVVVNFFAALPWGAAPAAVAALAPPRMRAQAVALFVFVLSLFSGFVGPWSVAALTDHVFRSKAALPYSLAIVNVIGMTLAIAFLTSGLRAYREAIARSETSPD
jgi:MFS family permease